MARLLKKRRIADCSDATRAHNNRQASNTRNKAERADATNANSLRDTNRVHIRLAVSSTPATATALGRADTSRLTPSGWRAATAKNPPSARPSSRNGVRTTVLHQFSPANDAATR